jgi:recombination protein RecA
MSSAVVSTSAAQGRPFVFDEEDVAGICPQPSGAELFTEARPPQRVLPSVFPASFKDARLAGVAPASQLAVRPAPEMVSSGIAAIDALTGGLPRGCLTEICGPASSGRTTLLLAALAAATRRGECCAVVDASDALDPQSVAAAGVELERLLWVRCGESSHQAGPRSDKRGLGERRLDERRLEQVLRVADLLLESGGFGMIALDLGDLPPQVARRIPLTTWFRFRRAVEHTSTVLLAVERQSIAGSCSSLLIKLGLIKLGLTKLGMSERLIRADVPTHAQLLTGVEITAELARSRLDRKPVRSAEITFASKTAWAG